MDLACVLSAPSGGRDGGGGGGGSFELPAARRRRPTRNSSGEEFFSFKESNEWQTSPKQQHQQAANKSESPIKVGRKREQSLAGKSQEDNRRQQPAEIKRERLHERPADHIIESRLSFFEKRSQSAASNLNRPSQEARTQATGATVIGGGGGGESTPARRSSLLDELLEGRKGWPEQRTVIVEIKNGRRVSPEPESTERSRSVEKNSQPPPPSLSKNKLEANKTIDQKPGPHGGSLRTLASETRTGSLEKRPPSWQEAKQEAPEQIEKRKPQEGKQDDNRAKGNKPPTFGSTPHKLTRLPYFSYFGKARNVSLVSAADRKRADNRESYSRKENSSSGLSGEPAASSESTSSSQRSEVNSPEQLSSSSSRSTSLLSRIPGVLSSRGENRPRNRSETARTQTGSSNSTRGYSNISNLFPGKPMSVRGLDRRMAAETAGEFAPDARYASGRGRQSSSLLNLNQLGGRLPMGKRANSASRFATDHLSRTNSTTNNAYRYRAASQIPRDFIDDDIALDRAAMRRQNGARPARQAYQGRPWSASGGYLAGRTNYRSPSAGSLYYGPAGSAGVSPYGNDYRNQAPIDPDCPVHGYSPPPVQTGANRDNLLTKGQLGAGMEPELLYDPYPRGADDEGYYERGHKSAESPYSPTSPPMGRPAYYNSASRFSVFHSPEAGAVGKASLAAPQEQLRRILGYQPPTKPIHLHPQWAYTRPFIHLQGAAGSHNRSLDNLDDDNASIKPRFEAYNQLHDAQAIRAVDFHPSGEVYAVGSNSRALRICAYPADHQLRHFNPQDHVTGPPRILFKFLQVHRGSIYCVRFNSTGQLLATGSNDQTVHIVRYNSTTHSPDGDEFRLTMHDGTVRDLCFIDDTSNGSSLLLSAGGGDNKIYVTDCDTITPFQSMAGHTQMVMALDHWSGASFVSASYDRTVRFWDLRTRNCTSIISAPPSSSGKTARWGAAAAGPGAPACSVKVDPSGRLLASGHSDSTCMLYDIRGARLIQAFRAHEDELRTVSFSPKSYYLLTGGYDGRILLTDLQGDLTQPLPSVCVAESDDKIVQSSWHPSDFTFVTTGADKTATLWALPAE